MSVSTVISIAIAALVIYGLLRFVQYVRISNASPPLSDAEIEQLARQGQTIRALREYRKRHGVGLKYAKEAIEVMTCNQPMEFLSDAEIRQLVRQGQKIRAIKEYRLCYGVGLKEAKEAIESIMYDSPV